MKNATASLEHQVCLRNKSPIGSMFALIRYRHRPFFRGFAPTAQNLGDAVGRYCFDGLIRVGSHHIRRGCFLGQYGGTANAVLLGVMIGAMMCVGLGGPINKAAYTFAVGLLTTSRWLW